MSTKSLSELSDTIRKIDIAILSTHTENGEIASRPMSNNGEVEYDGDSYYFTDEASRVATDIEQNGMVSLGFQRDKSFFICVQGRAELIRDKAEFEARWHAHLDRWFPNGVDTDGLVLIKVQATRITYWDGEEEGEVRL
ncbi:MAG: pyridoxamine 5'-phosphate oxidase family protein [Rhodomicrobium sp.]|nr:pyridoxamine 5'-phosphate oxidase family protein [Rhodomicrobium sp.]